MSGGTRSRAMAASIDARGPACPIALSRPAVSRRNTAKRSRLTRYSRRNSRQRIGMVVGADIEVGIRIARADLQPGGLPAALVAAGRLAGLQRVRSAARPCCRRSRDMPPACAARRAGPASMLPATDTSCPRTCPAQVTQSGSGVLRDASGGVEDVELPLRRRRDRGRPATPAPHPAASPARSRGIACTAYIGLTSAWVASAATPPSTWMHIAPTAKKRDATAAPSAPVAGSRTRIE